MGSRVLVVDDDPWILRMVTATLEKKKYVVDTAREGRQALERCQAKPPDVIITDIMMPVMDGWTFVQHLRQDPRLAGIPVIFLTALSKEEARLNQMGLSADDYLAKPFRFDDLESRVSKAVARGPAHVSGVYPAPDESGVFGSRDSGVYEAVEDDHSEPIEPTPDRISFTPIPNFSEPDPEPEEERRHPTPAPSTLPPTPVQPASSGSAPSVPTGVPPHHTPAPGQSGQPGQPGYYPPGYGYNQQQQPGYPHQGGYSGGYPPGYPPGYPGYPPQQGYPPGYPQQGGYPPAGYPPGYPAPGAPGVPPAGVPGAPGTDPNVPAPAPAPEAAQPEAPRTEQAPAPATRASKTVPRRPTALNGRLEQLGLSSLLVMMEMERKDGVLTLKESEDSDTGRIFIRGGQVICAKFDSDADRDGKECVYEMLAWKKGTFSFNATEVDMEDTIESSTTHLLMEGARLMDEAARDTI